ncbi:Protein RALF-like 33 [Linum perenne]
MLVVSSFPVAVASSGGAGAMESWIPIRSSDSDDDEEFGMESEISRRILQQNNRYISYGALRRNTVPCSRRGASYYNCRSGAQANPYSRGCSAITRCRR